MSFNRKFKRKHKTMKKIIFPAQTYKYVENEIIGKENNKDIIYTGYKYILTEESIVGSLELLWASVQRSPLQDLNRNDHKINKRLKKKLREITRFKDKNEDSRISRDGLQILILEEDEFSLMKRHLDSNKFGSAASEDVSLLWEIIDAATDYIPPKPDA